MRKGVTQRGGAGSAGIGLVEENRLRINLVGDVQVQLGTSGLTSRQLGGTKPRLILVSLVLAAGRPVSKERLIVQLWGEHPPAGAVPALESYVSVLRSRLSGLGCSPWLVGTVPHGYRVEADGVSVDVWDGDAVLAGPAPPRGGCPTSAIRRAVRDTLASLDSPLLPDEADLPWLEEARARHSRRRSELRGLAARYELEAGDAEAALRLTTRSLEQDQLDERAWCTLLESYVLLGQPVEALRAFTRCREVFVEQLGCAPGPRMQAILERALLATADDGLGDLLSAVLHLGDTTASRPEEERLRLYARARMALTDAVSA